MVEEGGDISAFEPFTIEDAGGQKAAPAPPKEPSSESAQPSDAGNGETTTPKPEPTPAPEDTGATGGKLEPALDRIPNASAAAVRFAIENGVKIAGIKGTGTGGQVTLDDVKKSSSGGTAGAGAGVPAASYVDTPISSMRKTIASRLSESWTQNPHYFVAATVSVSKLLKLRQALNASADGKYKLSVNDFLIKASAVACKKVPAVNSSWRDGFIRQFNNVDVSVSLRWKLSLAHPLTSPL
jgi:pyruvate dehydrogenase E2 component (dihydrolipoamide acetyltransferase)